MKKLLILLTLFMAMTFVYGQGLETFDNLGITGSSYQDGTFLGQDGSTWTFFQCRGDVDITGKAIMLGRNRTPQPEVFSGTIDGGIGELSFDYMQAFGTNVNLNVLVNDVVVGNVTSSGQQNVVLNSGTISVNVEGLVVIKFTNVNNSDGQVVIDNVEWTAFGDITNAAMPQFSHPSGDYFAPFDLEITSATEGAAIYYTTDGTDPDDSSILYVDPITISEDVTIKAIAYATGLDPSAIAEAVFTFPEPSFAEIPYSETFDTDLGDCFVYSVSGPSKTWEWSSSAGNGFAMMNGFNTGDIEEDWLILPGIELDFDDVIMSFETAYNFGNDDEDNYLKLFYSTDYAGVGDPTPATWTELPFTQPATGGYVWTPSGSLDLSGISGTTWIGFKYRYEPGNYRLWQVDNIEIIESTQPLLSAVPGTLSGFSYVVGEGPSASQEFTLSGLNLDPESGNIAVTGSSHFDVSLDDVTFSGAVLIPYTGGELAATAVYVHLKAGLEEGAYPDESIEIDGGGALAVEVMVSGQVTAPPPDGYFVDFEADNTTFVSGSTGYAAGIYNLNGIEWQIGPEALIGSLGNDKKNGLSSARVRRSGDVPGELFMTQDKPNGIGTLSFLYARYGSETDQPILTVQYSVNEGADWTTIGQVSDFPDDLTEFTADVNVDGNVRIRFITDLSGTNQRRLNIDDIQLSDYDGGLPTAAVPEFSAPSGNYEDPFVLEITSATPGANIYYTTDGSDPNTGSTLYTDPITVSETVTIKARAYAEGYNPSGIATAVYMFPGTVSSVAELRALAVGQQFILTSEVVLSYQQEWRNQKFVQDETGGILIDDNAATITTEYQIGDGITGIEGVVGSFNGMLQIVVNQDPGPPSSTGNELVPVVLTLEQLYADFFDHQSRLVKIEDVTFDVTGGNFIEGTIYPITDPSPTDGEFRTTFFDADYLENPIPLVPVNLIVIPNTRSFENHVTSRFASDIEPTVVVPSITVVSPNGFEFWERGTTQEIIWTSQNFDGNIRITLTRPPFSTWPVAVDIPNTGSFMWAIPSDQPLGNQYKIRIQGMDPGDPIDESNDFFSIIEQIPVPEIVITEIMYNPPEVGQDSLEYIEFYNKGLDIINMEGWTISNAVNYTFPDVTIEPGEYLVVAVNASAFFNTFGMEVLQWTSGALGNSGNTIVLTMPPDIVIDEVAYNNTAPWPVAAAGHGPSLGLIDPSLDNSSPENWAAETNFLAVNADGLPIYGTPGAPNFVEPAQGILIPTGWGGVSAYVNPDQPAVDDIMEFLIDDLTIMQNFSQIFFPFYNVNTIGDWNNNVGYQLRMEKTRYLVIPGETVTNKTVNLNNGWNGMPVLSECPADAATLFGGNPAVIFVKEMGSDNVYWPDGGITTLSTLIPGRAYYIKVDGEVSITFPDCE